MFSTLLLILICFAILFPKAFGKECRGWLDKFNAGFNREER